MSLVMRPDQLSSILRKVSSRFSVGCNTANNYPEGGISYKRDDQEVYIGACEWGEMAPETVMEKDYINPHKKTYQRRGWRQVIRMICRKPEIPLDVRRKVYNVAEKRGYKDSFDPKKPENRLMWYEMRGL